MQVTWMYDDIIWVQGLGAPSSRGSGRQQRSEPFLKQARCSVTASNPYSSMGAFFGVLWGISPELLLFCFAYSLAGTIPRP